MELFSKELSAIRKGHILINDNDITSCLACGSLVDGWEVECPGETELPTFLTLEEFAAVSGLSLPTLKYYARINRIEGARKVKGRWMVPATTLETIEISPVGRPIIHGRRSKRKDAL